jgi:hypothetical protein
MRGSEREIKNLAVDTPKNPESRKVYTFTINMDHVPTIPNVMTSHFFPLNCTTSIIHVCISRTTHFHILTVQRASVQSYAVHVLVVSVQSYSHVLCGSFLLYSSIIMYSCNACLVHVLRTTILL